jgi:hypothetical protein
MVEDSIKTMSLHEAEERDAVARGFWAGSQPCAMYVGSEALTEVVLKSSIFSHTTLCSPLRVASIFRAKE